MIQRQSSYLIVLFFITLIPLTASAADFHVTTAQELQTALSTCNSNGVDDIVYLSVGTYTGNFSYQPTEHKSIIIKAEDGLNPGQVVLDGDSNGRTLLLNAGSNVADMTVERISIINGFSYENNGCGANIYTAGNINIIECTFSNNTGQPPGNVNGFGLGAYLYGEDILIENSRFSGHFSQYRSFGSGLYIANATNISINGNTFMNNTFTDRFSSGVLYFSDSVSGSLNISNNHFKNNSSVDGVGVISFSGLSNEVTITVDSNIIEHNSRPLYFFGSGRGTLNLSNNIINNNDKYNGINLSRFKTINITENIITNNSSTNFSGGLNVQADITLTLKDNTISDNRANTYYGAGSLTAPNMTVTNNIITGNTAGTYAGGLHLSSSDTLHFTNNTVYGNTATSGDGGGIYTEAGGAGGLHFYNNIIWGNSASGEGDDLYLTGTGSADKNLKYNSIHDYAGTLFNFVSDNIDVDPLFIDSGNDDFHLGAASLCLDVGLNTAPGITATDLDGNTRILNVTVDLGAYEHSTGDYHPADTTANWIISSDEFTAYSNSWKTTGSAVDIDYVTRAGYLLQNGNPAGKYQNVGGGKPLCWIPVP